MPAAAVASGGILSKIMELLGRGKVGFFALMRWKFPLSIWGIIFGYGLFCWVVTGDFNMLIKAIGSKMFMTDKAIFYNVQLLAGGGLDTLSWAWAWVEIVSGIFMFWVVIQGMNKLLEWGSGGWTPTPFMTYPIWILLFTSLSMNYVYWEQTGHVINPFEGLVSFGQYISSGVVPIREYAEWNINQTINASINNQTQSNFWEFILPN